MLILSSLERLMEKKYYPMVSSSDFWTEFFILKLNWTQVLPRNLSITEAAVIYYPGSILF